jgi:hypothetical protein
MTESDPRVQSERAPTTRLVNRESPAGAGRRAHIPYCFDCWSPAQHEMLATATIWLNRQFDGKQAAASPVMRVLSPAWRFDVEIPAGVRMLSIVAMDAGDGSREDFADWANAGFIVEK